MISDILDPYGFSSSFTQFKIFIKIFKMQKSIVVILALVIGLQSLAEGMDEQQRKDCLKLSKRTLKKMLKSFNKCNAELKFHEISGEEYQKKIGCVVKCVMKKTEVLDASDIMTTELLKKSIESHVPPEYVDFAHDYLSKCITKIPLDPKDENCKSYLDMGTCLQEVLADMCGVPPML